MQVQAAILDGPNGQFAVLRASTEPGEQPISTEQRRTIARCFKERHNNIPVAFLANEPTGMRLLGYEDATDDLQECVRELVKDESALPWKEFRADA
jgi:hypothetical protein